MNRNVDAGMTPGRATAWDRRVWRGLLPYPYLGEHTGLSLSGPFRSCLKSRVVEFGARPRCVRQLRVSSTS